MFAAKMRFFWREVLEKCTKPLNWRVVTEVFLIGVIIPVLKKSTLNSNAPKNYRPITVGSTHAKLVGNLLVPDDNAGNTQFGFRKNRGTDIACAFLHDVITIFNEGNSPVVL